MWSHKIKGVHGAACQTLSQTTIDDFDLIELLAGMAEHPSVEEHEEVVVDIDGKQANDDVGSPVETATCSCSHACKQH